MCLSVLCRNVAAAVLYVMHTVVVSSNFAEPRWLYAVPLYHLLSKAVKPFAGPSEHGSTAHETPDWWGITHFVKVVEEFKCRQKATM